MRKKRFSILIVFFIIALTVSACTNVPSNEPQTNINNQNNVQTKVQNGDVFLVLQKDLEGFLTKDNHNTICPTEVYEKVVLEKDPKYFVVDIRDANAFASGNIPTSVNIPYAKTAEEYMINRLPKDKKIVVVCYSGHQASQTAAFWRALGYDAVAMLNGMGGWTADKALGIPLAQQTFNYPVETTVTTKITENKPPVVEENVNANVKELLIKQAKDYLASGQKPVISPQDVKTKVLDGKDSKYFLVDIREAKDYQSGHLAGAINIPAKEIAKLENLKKLPTDKKLILIDYNGHLASEVTRILNILGYETYAMKDGMRIWTDNATVNGIQPITAENIANLPTKALNFKAGGATAG